MYLLPTFKHNQKYKITIFVLSNSTNCSVFHLRPPVTALCHTNQGNGVQINCNWQHEQQLPVLLQLPSVATTNWLENVQTHHSSLLLSRLKTHNGAVVKTRCLHCSAHTGAFAGGLQLSETVPVFVFVPLTTASNQVMKLYKSWMYFKNTKVVLYLVPVLI